MSKNESVLATFIKGDVVDIDQYKNPQGVYDFLDYYEMNLYGFSNQKELKRRIDQLKEINDDNISHFEKQIASISKELENNRIEYCVMVGIPFAERYHRDPQRRFQEDIDFFISESDMDTVASVMERLGYYAWNAEGKKKHITYINDGKTGDDTSRDGRCAVKFYKRMTDTPYKKIVFEDVSEYIEVYNGYKIFEPAMALFHLILHAHYYDFHPKIMCDIYAIINSGKVNVEKFYNIVDRFSVQRITRIVIGTLKRWGVETTGYVEETENERFICDVLSMTKYWEQIFTRLDKNELTLLRCFLFNESDYRSIYKVVIENDLVRRVSPMRDGFAVF